MTIEKCAHIKKDSPIAQRWLVVSVARIATAMLERLKCPNPNEAQMEKLIVTVKKHPELWTRLLDKARDERSLELDKEMLKNKGLDNGDGNSNSKNAALLNITARYTRIDEDPILGYKYLDPLILEPVDENPQAE
jgi:hypothetical protein